MPEQKGFRDRGGRLRTRDLQMTTNPCAPESCLAAPRSAHLLTKSLVHKQLGCTRQGEGGELKTREREEKKSGHRRRRDLNPRHNGHNQPLGYSGQKQHMARAPSSISSTILKWAPCTRLVVVRACADTRARKNRARAGRRARGRGWTWQRKWRLAAIVPIRVSRGSAGVNGRNHLFLDRSLITLDYV